MYVGHALLTVAARLPSGLTASARLWATFCMRARLWTWSTARTLRCRVVSSLRSTLSPGSLGPALSADKGLELSSYRVTVPSYFFRSFGTNQRDEASILHMLP